MAKMTTHCSGELQKVLTITDPGQTREKLLLRDMGFKLIEDEQNHLKTAVRHQNSLGYGEGKLEAGCVLNQAVLLGAVNYLMHYDIHAVGEVQFAYLSHKNFNKGVESINSMAIESYVDFLLHLPGFEHLSRGVARKIIYCSKMVNIPKDWRLLS